MYKQIQTCIYKLFEKEANGFLSRDLNFFVCKLKRVEKTKLDVMAIFIKMSLFDP